MIDLYTLLPQIIKLKDTTTIGSDTEGVLEKIVYAIEQEADTANTQIIDLFTLINPQECDAKYLYYISQGLGYAVSDSSELNIKFSRWFVENLTFFFRIIGTHHSWTRQWTYVDGESTLEAEELWKSIPNERGNYYRDSEVSDYYGLLHSARVDLHRGNNYLSIHDAEEFMKTIEWCRPIHVLLRKRYREFDFSDTEKDITETVDRNAGLGLEDGLEDASDELDITISCITMCESVCEPGLEVGCLTSCELNCEFGI